jgi:dynein heavy chain, axonemal
VLIEDIAEDLSPSIDPILLRQEFLSDAGWQIKIGEKVEDYDKNFKLFMTTKMANPEYKPEVCIKVTLINFTVTFQGLEEQLLGDVVVKERPEVEIERDKIVMQMAADQASLKRIENMILKQLSESEIEEILDKDDLIDTLSQSKITASEINERMAKAVVVTEQIA